MEITKGTTGQAPYVGYGFDTWPGIWRIVVNGSLIFWPGDSGWNVTLGDDVAFITVPGDAPSGNGYLEYSSSISHQRKDNYQFNIIDVPCSVTIDLTCVVTERLEGGEYRHAYLARAEVTGGSEPRTYNWTAPGTITEGQGTELLSFRVTNANASGLTDFGTVSVQVSSAGCEASDSETVAHGIREGENEGQGTPFSGPGWTQPFDNNLPPLYVPDPTTHEQNGPFSSGPTSQKPPQKPWFNPDTGQVFGPDAVLITIVDVADFSSVPNSGEPLLWEPNPDFVPPEGVPFPEGPFIGSSPPFEGAMLGTVEELESQGFTIISGPFDSAAEANCAGENCGPGYGYYFNGENCVVSPPAGTPVTCITDFHDDGTGHCVADPAPGEAAACAAGFHDDGTGVCIADADANNPTTSQPCAPDFFWNGARCVADPGADNAPGCTVAVALEIEDLGEGDYLATVFVTSSQTGMPTVAFLRDGVALANETPTTALFSLALGSDTTIVAIVTDGDCQDAARVIVQNSDAPDAGSGNGETNVPVKPLPPIPISKSTDSIVLSPSHFTTQGETPGRATTRMRLFRDGIAAPLVEWMSEAGTFTDTAVSPLQSFFYRVQAGNASGWSEISEPLTVALLSSTCIVTIRQPVEGATWFGTRQIDFSVVDTGGAASGARVEWGGAPLPASRLLPPDSLFLGTNQSGLWRLVWDTRTALQGTKTLRALALGSDGLWAFAETQITLANTPANTLMLAEVGPLRVADLGAAFRGVHVGLETGALSEAPSRRYWAQMGLRAWNEGQSDPFPAPPQTPDEAALQWEKHQKVALRSRSIPAQGNRPQRHFYYETPRLQKPAQNVVARLQLSETELPLAWKLAPATQLLKARETASGGIEIFGRPGTMWEFGAWGSGPNPIIEPRLVADFADAGWSDATDAARLGDKIYLVRPETLSLWVLDSTAGDAPYSLRLRSADGMGEPRAPRFIERAKLGTVETILAFCVDETLSPATRIYRVAGTDMTLLWSLDDAVTATDVCGPNPADLYVLSLACGPRLWRADLRAGTPPTLQHAFTAPITALDATRVGLQNGEIWAFVVEGAGNGWQREWAFEPAMAVSALAAWSGGGEISRGIAAAQNSVELVEQSLNAAQPGQRDWVAGRVISNPSQSGDVVSKINALRRFAFKSPNASEEDRADERLMALTGSNGLLVVYYVSPLSQSSGATLIGDLKVFDVAPSGSRESLETIPS